MKLPFLLSLVAAAACLGEPVSAVLDEKGHATCVYKIDSVFPEGIFVRTEGKAIWLEVPYSQSAVRNAIMRNQNKQPESVLASADPEPVLESRPAATPVPATLALADAAKPGRYTFDQDYVGYSKPRPMSGHSGQAMTSKPGGFIFNMGDTKRSTAIATEEIKAVQRFREATQNIPGIDSRRELPWEFARNEVAMWLIWFSTTDESVPGNAETNSYIAEQNTQGMLLYRLLIKPWLRNKKD